MNFRALVKRERVVRHFAFLAGIQLSVCVEILVDYYMSAEPFVQAPFWLAVSPVVGALLLGASSYYSIAISWEVGEILSIGHRADETLVKRGIIIDEEFEKEVNNRLLGRIKKLGLLKAYFITDIVLTIVGIALIIGPRLIRVYSHNCY